MIRVYFHCRLCQLKDYVDIDGRKDPNKEDVAKWMNRVAALASVKHSMESHSCTAQVMDIMVPLPKDEPNAWIGKEYPDEQHVDPNTIKFGD